ncbi:uncharacterized protein Dsimw501_GD27658, isoform B [Drosophila simulans]|uniref:Uncharacterized protein, isoform B n=1 Tax=Drosophila simulans TaxID=7240 RepID=A0A0J9RIL8_DROSI|nr:uncharacterized protein Dsimw501_GD27658, isoform B [Drosophila simulans]
MCCWFSLVLVAVVFYQNAVAQLLDENCDIRIGYRVKNGYPPKTTQFMAALYNKSEFLCGGSLIHKQYVLTAAHCVSGFDEVTVHLGENNRSCPIPVCKHVLQLNAKVILNSQWEDCIFLNDIALLRLNREVKFEAHIRPICIILDENVTSDSQNHFTAFGWGMTEHRGLSDVLKAVELVRLSKYECYQNVGTICAGSHLGDTCRGDSGGPLAGNMVYRGKSRHIQFGIVSYGNVDCDGSNGVYTDLNAHKSWIASVVLESEPRLLNENCKSDWGAKVYVRLWEMSLFEHKFAGALITNQFVVTVASAFPDNFNATEM